MTQVIVKDLHLRYPLILSTRSLRKELLKTLSLGLLHRHEEKRVNHIHSLKGISFEAHEGDRIGIVGRNGAGKSTLLKILSGIYFPSEGELTVEGSVEALLNPSLGIEPEETGVENIHFALDMAQVQKTEKAGIEQDVRDFTELGDFLDHAVRTYSTGMRTRLGFALATIHAPEILIMDEVIGAGDAAFYKKADRRLRDLADKTKIIFLASHSGELIRDWCNKVMWIDHGKIKDFGPVNRVLDAYLDDRGAD